MTTTQEKIRTGLQRLAVARMSAELAHEMKLETERRFWEQPENAQLLEAQKETRKAVEVLENELRELIKPTFDPEKGKKFEGYGFRELQKVEIVDEKKALQWSIRNFTPALTLNKSVFVNAVKAGSIPDELATVSTELTVTIASDLGKFVSSKGE